MGTTYAASPQICCIACWQGDLSPAGLRGCCPPGMCPTPGSQQPHAVTQGLSPESPSAPCSPHGAAQVPPADTVPQSSTPGSPISQTLNAPNPKEG